MSARPLLTLALLALAASGCTAIKATAHIAQIEEAIYDAEDAKADSQAVYEYTLATEYRLKAHEEWGYSSFGAAEMLARKATDYARQAEEMARYGSTDEDTIKSEKLLEQIDDGEDVVPEQLEKPIEKPIEGEDIDLEDLDLDEEW